MFPEVGKADSKNLSAAPKNFPKLLDKILTNRYDRYNKTGRDIRRLTKKEKEVHNRFVYKMALLRTVWSFLWQICGHGAAKSLKIDLP